jgi:hypothetical protein
VKQTLTAILLVGLGSLASAQQTITVPGDVSNIQTAISIANPGDTILVSPGTYNETIDFLGKAVTVESVGGPDVTVLDPLGLANVVRFHNQERGNSILRGFTVTGGVSTTDPGGGISCLNLSGTGGPASPLIQNCIIEDNQTTLASGGGVGGNATLEDCIIRNNDAGIGCGGGVWGAAQLRNCLVTGNAAANGGGLYLLGDGSSVEDTKILQNVALDGARGGGIHAAPGLINNTSIVIERCTIVGNTSNGLAQASSRGGAIHVSAPADVVSVEKCTILYNHAVASIGGDDYGGIFGPANVWDSIVRENEFNQVNVATTCRYSNIGGGCPGIGNLDAPAIFVDADNENYMLVPGSPGVDGGDPASPLDPDCTRSDQGAFPLFQASVTIRNGSGVNPVCFHGLSFPVIGSTWLGRVDTSVEPTATVALVIGDNGFLETPFPAVFGEVMIELDSIILVIPVTATGGFDSFSVPIPNELNLIGFDGAIQVFLLNGLNVIGACNALQVKLGL